MPRFENTNVRTDRGPFIGRSAELAAIELAFSSGSPLITLVGAPGTGKTRLAQHYAARERETLCDSGGVWFCDLSDARSADELSVAVAASLGVPLLSHAAGDGAGRLGYALARRGPLLLVLDNFEQLPAEAAEIVARWVRAAPQAMMLVTSQRRLGLEDEHVLSIEPLEPPSGDVADPELALGSPAVELFVARARSVRADYRLDAENAPLVSALVRRLEGIPLGIELCAARIGVLGERQLLELLERQLDVAVLGRGMPARHSTLRTAIGWSWELLRPWQQAALAQCSVFRGGFSLEAIEHVVHLAGSDGAPSGPLSATEVVRSLTAASLLRAYAPAELPNERRYALLDSVQKFAAEQLDERELASARARHAEHFRVAAKGWSAQVDGLGGVAIRHRLALELPNVLAAHEHELDRGALDAALELLLSLETVFSTRGPFGRYTSLLDRALERAESVDPAIRARAFASRGLLAILQGRLDAAIRDYETARSEADLAEDGETAAFAGVKIGLCCGLAGRRDEAERWFTEARARIGPDATLRVKRTYFNDLGLVRTQQGAVEEAEACLERALELHQRAGNRRDEGVTLGNLGGRLYERGALVEALDHYERSLEVLREVGDRRSAGVMLAHIGQLEHELGRFDSARAKLSEALAVEREVGDRAWEGIVLGMLGNLDLEEERAEDAAERFQQSVVTLTGSSYRRNAGLSLASLAVAEALSGRSEAASRAIERSREILCEVGSASDREACALLELAAELAASGPELRERAARRHAEAGVRAAELPDEVRFALRILKKSLERAPAAPRASRPAPALEVGPRASWFRAPGGERVDLSRRGPLRRLLLTLVERRAASPGAGVSPAELARGAWPEAPDGARGVASRVYVGVGTLRRLGLGALLARGDDGYFLDPAIELSWTRSESEF